MTIKKISLRFIASIALIILGYSTTASAMTITPVRYEVKGNPGETLVQKMTIINEDSIPVTYYSSFTNFEAQGETGSASFVAPKDDIGTWIKTIDSVTLSPGEQKTVDFTINIPMNAEPGGHFGVVFWGTSPENGADGKQLSVSAKTGLLVLLSVNGYVKEGGGLLDFITKDNQFWYNTLPVSFVYRFKNDGGDRVKPVGKIRISNTLFIPTKRFDANPVNGNILPASTRKFTTDWVISPLPKDELFPTGVFKSFVCKVVYQWKNFAVGLYSAHLNITYGSSGQVAKKTVFFFVFPWQLLICLAILFIFVFFSGKKLVVSYNNYIIKKAHSSLVKPEDASHV